MQIGRNKAAFWQQLHHSRFWPPFLLLAGTTLLSLINKDRFLIWVHTANQWILDHFSWLFGWGVLSFLVLVLVVYFSPLSRIRIGGPQAKPLLSRWKWFSITLCTTIATGILFWGTAEPLFHFNEPPESLGLAAGSDASAQFAMSTMYLHWTFSPYAMYTLAGLIFSLSFYSFRQPFETGSFLYPLFGRKVPVAVGTWTDVICLYSLVGGMAASLGAGILTIAGGVETVLGWSSSRWMLALVGMAIVVVFVASAASGLMKGIRILSDYNIKAFMALALFFAVLGPVAHMAQLGLEGAGQYIHGFLPRSVNWNQLLDTGWFQGWTIFNWANWLAWTPVTALFLGRLGVGYTVREYIHINLFFPALFGMIWMTIFSGTAIYFDQGTQGGLFAILKESGPENVIYRLFEEFPASQLVGVVFLLITFISYVTAADSNTSAMSSISSKDITIDQQESPLAIKVLWGSIVGVMAWVMVSFAGIDGIKMISVLGGFPSLFLVILVAIGTVRLLLSPAKFGLK